MQMSARFGSRLALLLALLAPVGCDMFMKPGPTAVAQGRYYASGNPEYDAFFVELHRLQVELKDAPDRAAEPRQALAKALDVGVDADVIKEALGKKASELNAHQIKFTVQKPASPDKPSTLHVTGSPSGDAAELQKTLEDALAKISELKIAADGWQKALEPLPEREAALESNVDTAFADKPPRTRSEVRANLTDGRKIIDLLVTRAQETARTNGELLDAMTSALGEAPAANGDKSSETAPSAAPASGEKKGRKSSSPPPKSEKPAKPGKAAKPEPKPKPEPKSAPKPEPKPAKAKPEPKPKPAAVPPPKAPAASEPKAPAKAAEPKPAPEVPPPSKPTQGTAKPDFEP